MSNQNIIQKDELLIKKITQLLEQCEVDAKRAYNIKRVDDAVNALNEKVQKEKEKFTFLNFELKFFIHAEYEKLLEKTKILQNDIQYHLDNKNLTQVDELLKKSGFDIIADFRKFEEILKNKLVMIDFKKEEQVTLFKNLSLKIIESHDYIIQNKKNYGLYGMGYKILDLAKIGLITTSGVVGIEYLDGIEANKLIVAAMGGGGVVKLFSEMMKDKPKESMKDSFGQAKEIIECLKSWYEENEKQKYDKTSSKSETFRAKRVLEDRRQTGDVGFYFQKLENIYKTHEEFAQKDNYFMKSRHLIPFLTDIIYKKMKEKENLLQNSKKNSVNETGSVVVALLPNANKSKPTI